MLMLRSITLAISLKEQREKNILQVFLICSFYSGSITFGYLWYSSFTSYAGVTSLVFKIDGKKWVRFVAIQQDSATSIYDLNSMKGTMES